MSHFQFPHPWNPRFAIPKYVLSEPQGRGAFITKQLPRGTIGTVPFDRQVWNRTKWAVPNYAQGRYDRSAMTTKMLPRRTVGNLAPDFFSRPSDKFKLPDPGRIDQRAHVVSTSMNGPKPTGPAWQSAFNPTGLGDCGTLTGSSIGGNTLAGSSLGDTAAFAPRKDDPIVLYGKKGAKAILDHVMKLPRATRSTELQGALESIGPTFRGDVEDKAKKYREAGHKPKEALRRGIAASLSNKLLEDMIHAGTNTSGNVFSELGGLVGWVKDTLSDIHCTVATSSLTKGAATIAGAAYGGVAGAAAAGAGANILAAPCGGGSSAAPAVPAYVPPPPAPSPLIPLAVAAGGALLLIMVLK